MQTTEIPIETAIENDWYKFREHAHRVISEADPLAGFDESYAEVFTGESRSSLQKKRTDGRGPRFVRSGRRVIYLKKDLLDYMASLTERSEVDNSPPQDWDGITDANMRLAGSGRNTDDCEPARCRKRSRTHRKRVDGQEG